MEAGDRRSDGRALDALRIIRMEQGLLNKADGSVRVSQGNTCVIVGIIGPVELPKAQQNPETRLAQISVDIRSATASNARTTDHQHKSLERRIQHSLEAVVHRSLYPHTQIMISVQIVEDDGCILSAALNGSCFALLDAGVSLVSLLTSSSLCILRSGLIIHDPTLAEQMACQAQVTIAVARPASEGGEGVQHVALLHSTGLMSKSVLSGCVSKLSQACTRIRAFEGMVVNQYLEERMSYA